MKKNNINILLLLLALTVIGCKQKNDTIDNSPEQPKQYNISILLDLSDRIKEDGQLTRDTAAIKVIADCFVAKMDELKVFNSKGKIKVFAYPAPANQNINELMADLDQDCSKMDNKAKKEVYENLAQKFQRAIQEIYDNSLNSGGFHGSDIWTFFKDDVENYCIDKDTNYRNVLVILTDGYVYERETRMHDVNRYSYIIDNAFDNISKYRGKNSIEKIEKDDFGLITKRNDLDQLEILVLEVNPHKSGDYDILQHCLSKWFKEMNVKRYKICKTDFPNQTKKYIENFLQY